MTALAVGTFSSYLTAVLVDGTFRQKERRERERLQDTALMELRNSMNNYLKLLRVWYRSSLEEIPESPPDSLKQVIETNEIETVRLLNFAETYPVYKGADHYTFLTHSHHLIKQIQEDIDLTLQKYSHFVDPNLISQLQELRDPDLFNMIVTYEEHGIHSQAEILPLFVGDGYLDFQENIHTLLKIIEYYEEAGAPELTLLDISYMWRDDERPKVGSAKMDISLEDVQNIELSEEPPYQILGDDIRNIIENRDNM